MIIGIYPQSLPGILLLELLLKQLSVACAKCLRILRSQWRRVTVLNSKHLSHMDSTRPSYEKCNSKASGCELNPRIQQQRLLQLSRQSVGLEIPGSISSRRPWSCIFRNWSRLGLKMYNLSETRIYLTLKNEY